MNNLPPAAWGDPEARSARPWPPCPSRSGGASRHRTAPCSPASAAWTGSCPPCGRRWRHLRRGLRRLRRAAGGLRGLLHGRGPSALLACEEPELGAAAIFYGSAPPLERVPAIACPVAGFYGALDARVNAGLPAFAEAMRPTARTSSTRSTKGRPTPSSTTPGPATTWAPPGMPSRACWSCSGEPGPMTAPEPSGDFLVMAKPAGARCNLACAYCYYLPKAGLFPQAPAPRMDEALLETYIRQRLEASPARRPTSNGTGANPPCWAWTTSGASSSCRRPTARPGAP